MDLVDGSYLAAVGLAGAAARALSRGLPPSWKARLEAMPPEKPQENWIWLHAVSVGELILAEGILGKLREAGFRVHVTTGTSAGLELLAKRLPGWDGGSGTVSGGAFPLDDPAGMEGFLHPPPGAFVALETELWPNLLRELERHGVPRAIVNGRLTGRSLGRGGPWLRRAASRLSLVAARDEASAEAFRLLGAPWVELGGNLKADLPPPRPLHAGWNALREAWAAFPVLVAGNTVDGEEDRILATWHRARIDHPGLRLILAPRQPRRFQAVAADFAARGLAFRRASEPWPEQPHDWADTDALLLDTLGELPAAYGEGTLALVGGGWAWEGGHNPLEPVRLGLPTILGPGYRNFEDLVEPLLAAGRLHVATTEDLEGAVREALRTASLRPQAHPEPLPGSLAGTLERTWQILMKILPAIR